MSDSYQAVYDAVRSRIGGCDVGGAIESALSSAGFGDAAHMARNAIQQWQMVDDGESWGQWGEYRNVLDAARNASQPKPTKEST